MQSNLAHMQLNVRPENVPFYKDLFNFLGWKVIYDGGDTYFGTADTNGTSLWFVGDVKDVNNDYDGPGVNHLGIGVKAQADVDTAAKYVTEKGIAHLFETPRHRPDFGYDEKNTYYQVMFETPDRILLEIVYIGPKST